MVETPASIAEESVKAAEKTHWVSTAEWSMILQLTTLKSDEECE